MRASPWWRRLYKEGSTGMYGERQVWNAAAFLVAASVLASGAFADDAVGVLHVDAGTNGVAEVDMPFAPMSDIGPLGYVSGLFCGDGGAFSDRLFLRNPATGETTNAVWSYSAWLDPASLLPSFMQAHPGDTLYFMRTDAGPFDFSVFGRLPPERRCRWTSFRRHRRTMSFLRTGPMSPTRRLPLGCTLPAIPRQDFRCRGPTRFRIRDPPGCTWSPTPRAIPTATAFPMRSSRLYTARRRTSPIRTATASLTGAKSHGAAIRSLPRRPRCPGARDSSCRP